MAWHATNKRNQPSQDCVVSESSLQLREKKFNLKKVTYSYLL